MAITDKTRKILWALSGGRCALCRARVVLPGTEDPTAIVGDECHIKSKKPGGPRSAASSDGEDLDGISNLILLCRTHHKLVDDQPNRYTVEELTRLKADHERWVQSQLGQEVPTNYSPSLVPRLTSGKELYHIVDRAHAFQWDHDECENEEEADLLSGFFRAAQDWGELGSVSDPDPVRASFALSQDIKELEERGWFVFGERTRKSVRGHGAPMIWDVATVVVLRESNPTIVNVVDLYNELHKEEAKESRPEQASRNARE